MTDSQRPECDDDLPKLTAEEWAYIQSVVDAGRRDAD
jgi:hypothetical protein